MPRQKAPKCCFCLNVRVGSFVLAILVLLGGIFGLIGAALCLSNSVKPQVIGLEELIDGNGDYNRTALWVALGNGLFVSSIAAFAMYGMLKNRAGFLLPLFILQLFDFICTVIYLGNVVFYWRYIKPTILELFEQYKVPDDWKQSIENVDGRWLAVIVGGTLAMIMIIKSHLIMMVYKCYKHIKTETGLNLQHDPESNHVSDLSFSDGPIYKPPKYEDIQKVPLVDDVEVIDTKPPPYQI